ncbi:MAG: AAA-like domain-containing protein [Cyanobacteria bacterium J06598_4]
MTSDQKHDSNQWNIFLQQKALDFKFTSSQTRVFLARFARDNWLKTIEDTWRLSDVNSYEAFVKHSTEIYRAIKPYCCPEIGTGSGKFPRARDWLLEEFNQQQDNYFSPIDSSFTRAKIAAECEQAILQPGALIRIKAPRKMGKSRLLNHILNFAEQQNFSTVHINLLKIEKSKFANLDQFLRWFCIYISDALQLSLDLDQYWHQDRGSMLSCTMYLEAVLANSDRPLVLGLDEVDRLLNYPDISQDFFYLLRSWHEEANNDELWEQLRLAVVYSTEDFGTLDINQSPFNVGLPVELQPFELPEMANLAETYGLKISDRNLEQLMLMLGGQPYLVDLAMSYLASNSEIKLAQLLEQATTDTGIYNSYLWQHLINLKSNSQLLQVYLEVLNSSAAIQIDIVAAYQLYRMGLIKWSKDNTVMPSCELFRQYFLPRLQLTTANYN